jgi:Kef-type K+ transport system membrane component KefB
MHDILSDRIFKQFKLPISNQVLILTLILGIILIAPKLMRRMKMPGIVGFITAGILVGPYSLNLIQKNSAIEMFSTIGMLYIMFIAGIELDIVEFKKKKHKSLIFGLLTFIIPIVIGFPVFYVILNYSLITSLLTASMFATHTLVAYPIVRKYGIAKNEIVSVAIGGTILTDTAVLIILAIVLATRNGQLNSAFWLQLLISLSLFMGIMFWVIPRIAHWFFARPESEYTTHYVFVLGIVFLSGFLAQLAGVEPIIGAFMAGLTLNGLMPPSGILRTRIGFVGDAIFIPFFLISVGMLVDIQVLFLGSNALIVTLSLTVVALVGKWLSAWVTQRIFKYNKIQRKLLFGLSSSHAAATLAIIIVGYKVHLIDKKILNGTIILILITCIVASFATEKASKKIVATEDLKR